ncbi:MAG TPA: alpha-isopropylmalate synthase regulatory domain-containing protein, partial [Spongiibacteraceae bacterium]|nr:alpha-isopropylmalate synthase regulatory domain-containing protein [Spongiibacteraceae bacterium]
VNTCAPWHLRQYQIVTKNDERVSLQLELNGQDGSIVVFSGEGKGTLSAAIDALQHICDAKPDIVDYHEHALINTAKSGYGATSSAVSYVQIAIDGRRCWGVGIAEDTVRSALSALISAINRSAIQIRAVA